MDLAAEIKRLRSLAGIGSQKELARLVGVSQAFIGQLETGKSKGFTRDVELRLCRDLGVPPDHFTPFLSGEPKPLRVAAMPPRPLPSIPLAGRISAGRPMPLEEQLGHLDLADLFGRDGLVAFEVRGDSMTGAMIAPGDYVIIRLRPEAEHGEVVVATVDGDVVLKKLHRRKGEVLLLACHETMPPIRTDGDRPARVLGALHGVIRRVK